AGPTRWSAGPTLFIRDNSPQAKQILALTLASGRSRAGPAERVAFEIQKQIAGPRLWQRAQSKAGVDGKALVLQLPCLAPVKLQPGLMLKPLVGRRRTALRLEGCGQAVAPESGECGDAVRGELGALRARAVGDERQMIVLSQL